MCSDLTRGKGDGICGKVKGNVAAEVKQILLVLVNCLCFGDEE